MSGDRILFPWEDNDNDGTLEPPSLIVETFIVADSTDDSHQLTNIPNDIFDVHLNGVLLMEGDWSLSGDTVTISHAVYNPDEVTVRYYT